MIQWKLDCQNCRQKNKPISAIQLQLLFYLNVYFNLQAAMQFSIPDLPK